MTLSPRLIKIDASADMFRLLDELANDRSAFVDSRTLIADAWREGCLYGLSNETIIPCSSPLFSMTVENASTWDLFPCMCVSPRDGHAGILWVHKRARRRGLGRALVRFLGITNVACPLKGSIPFWHACGVFIPEEEEEEESAANDN